MSRWIFYQTTVSPSDHPLAVDVDTIEQFNSDDVFFIWDIFDRRKLNEIFNRKGLPGCIVNDTLESSQEQLPAGVDFYTTPFYPEMFSLPARYLEFDSSIDTQHTANFVVKKPQINRYLTAKIVELFNIDIIYTLNPQSLQHDMSRILEELASLDHREWLSQEQKSFLLSPITIPAHTLEPNYLDVSNNMFVNRWVSGLGKIFMKSAVALITESVAYQKEAVFTEKTVNPMLALNFPIWVGGFGQADAWKRCGFDVFDDVIDHGYQYLPTVIERCWWAIKLNIELLQNKQKAAELRQKHHVRLKHNRQLIIDNHLRNHNDSVVSSWPKNVQAQVLPWLNSWRKSQDKNVLFT